MKNQIKLLINKHLEYEMKCYCFKQFAVIPLLVLLLVFGCGSDNLNENQQEQVIPVKLADVEFQELAIPVHTSGQLVSPKEMKLSFKIGGILGRIFTDEGQRVKQGQLLAQLEQEEIQAKVQQARSAYQKAKRDFERVENLYQDSVATLEQKQDAQTNLDVAKSNLQIAEFNLKYSKIHAPLNGIVLKRFAEVNELVEKGVPIFYFGSSEKAWIVRVGISDRDVVRLQLGDSASVSFDAYPQKQFPAIVTEISESADPRTGTYEVELKVEQMQEKLASGFIAKVEIIPSKKQSFHIMPVEALVEADGTQGVVYTLNSEKKTAKRLNINLSRMLKDQIAVHSGLENISTVITEGAPYVNDGSKVKVVDE